MTARTHSYSKPEVALPPVQFSQTVLVRLIWTRAGVAWAYNVMAAQNTAGTAITQTLANTLGAAIKANFTSSGLAAATNIGVGLANIGVRDINTPSHVEFLDSGAAVGGSAAGKLLPPQDAVVITLRTALAGRSYRGRFYVPGSGENSYTSTGGVATATTTACQGFVQSMIAAFAASNIIFAVWSRPRPASGTKPAWPGAITPVLAAVARAQPFGTVRSRRV